MNEINTINYPLKDEELNILVDYEKETVWLTTDKIAKLFNKSRTVITKHIKKVIVENNLLINSVCANFAHTSTDGKTYNTKHYNLEIVIIVENRIRCKCRSW